MLSQVLKERRIALRRECGKCAGQCRGLEAQLDLSVQGTVGFGLEESTGVHGMRWNWSNRRGLVSASYNMLG